MARCDTRGTSCLSRGLSDCELNLCSKSLISFERFFFNEIKFIRFEFIKISVASFGIGVNSKLEKGERLPKGSKGLGELGLGSGKLSSFRQIVLASNRLRVKSSCTLGHLGQHWWAFYQDRLFCFIDSVIIIHYLSPRSKNILPSHDAQLELQSVGQSNVVSKAYR